MKDIQKKKIEINKTMKNKEFKKIKIYKGINKININKNKILLKKNIDIYKD